MTSPAEIARLTEPTQSASRVLMVRPGSFGRNDAAAETNAFMRPPLREPDALADAARAEFDGLAQALADAGVEVIIDDEPDLPDSVFPNNWMTFHQPVGADPVLITYPMATPARRLERRDSVVRLIGSLDGRPVRRIALEHLEQRGEHLEGTGSLVIDRVAGVAFACISPRTTPGALDAWEQATGIRVVRFDAADADGVPLYHTNVIMSMGRELVWLVADTVRDAAQLDGLRREVERLNKRVLDLEMPQMGAMCANVLELETTKGEPIIAMSSTAWNAYTTAQKAQLESAARIVHAPIPTIERVGGGSVRCMIAELGRHVFTRPV